MDKRMRHPMECTQGDSMPWSLAPTALHALLLSCTLPPFAAPAHQQDGVSGVDAGDGGVEQVVGAHIGVKVGEAALRLRVRGPSGEGRVKMEQCWSGKQPQASSQAAQVAE